MRMLKWILCLSVPVLIAVPAYANTTANTTKAAVFPFDFHDAQQDGEIVPQYNPEDLRRLKLVAEELKALMTKDGKYSIIDLAPKPRPSTPRRRFISATAAKFRLPKTRAQTSP